MKTGVPGWKKRLCTPLTITGKDGKKTINPEDESTLETLQDIIASISERFMEVEVCKYLKSPVPRVPYWCMSPLAKRVVWYIDRINKEMMAKSYLDNALKAEKPDTKAVARHKEDYNNARKFTDEQAEAWQKYGEHTASLLDWNMRMMAPYLTPEEVVNARQSI